MKIKIFVPLYIFFLAFAGNAGAGEFKFGPALTYVSGQSDVVDIYEANIETEFPIVFDVDTLEIPIGVQFFGRYEYGNGWRLDGAIGPFAIFLTEDNDFVEDRDHWELPIYGTVGYTIAASNNVAPYVRAGFAYHLVNGDYEVDSSPGFFIAAGVEFMRDRFMSWGFELSLDDSSVDLKTCENSGCTVFGVQEVNTYDVMGTIFMLF